MRIACVLMAHRDPDQLERLLKKLDHPGFDYYIHLDKKTDITPFAHLTQMERVHFVKGRIKVTWASYSFMKALVSSLTEIFNSGKSYDFITVMSGQDYPIKPIDHFYSHLQNNQGKNFICFEESDEWWNDAITRINQYHFINLGFKGKYRLQYLINSLLPPRKFPLPYKLYGGPRAMCMTLGLDCANYAVNFLTTHKRLRKFAFFTWGPDEFLFPTIVMNSQFKDSVVNDNFYYIDWTMGGASPKILLSEDVNNLVKSGKMFARKFDISIDPHVLDLIDDVGAK